MTQARRAAPRHPWDSVRDTVDPKPARAMFDPDEPFQPTASDRIKRLLVPGLAAGVAAAGTVGVVIASNRNATALEAVPAAVPQDISMREMGAVSRSEQRLLPAAETPSASAMASATPSAAPTPTATATSARPTATATPKATAKATPKASAAATTAKSSTTVASGSVADCPSPSGWLGANAQRVYEASCAAFPYVTAYGGSRAGDPGPHGTGNAVDIMISGDRGTEIANYMRANASKLGITEVIYQQQIWTTQRSSEGWRPMSDRGSVTANHYDHVHVTTS